MTVDYLAVGLLIGDPSNTLFNTDNIDALATLVGTATYPLAAACARSLAATYAPSVDKRAGDVEVQSSQRYAHYMQLAEQLEAEAKQRALGAISVYAGGISRADKVAQVGNSDRVRPYFTRHLHDDNR